MNLPHSEERASSDNDYRFGRGHAWFAFAMTIALMVVDYLDRQVIVSLFPHIKAAWGLSDKQLGALVSIVSVTVAFGALPIALLADRWSRVRSIAAMATVWSLATISCLFTRNYGQLIAARAMVGVGEAGYGSVGAALIASLFPARLRAGLLAAFFAAASVGSVLGVMLGGLIAARWGWQAAFGVVGLPGLLLALLYLKVRDYHTVALTPAQQDKPGGAAAFAVKSLFRSRTMSDKTALRPFQVEFPEADLTELRRRIKATRLPSKELVRDRSQGVQLATLRELARYWTTEYDWHKCEARLNALPQFTTEIDGVNIHFIHVRSRHGNLDDVANLFFFQQIFFVIGEGFELQPLQPLGRGPARAGDRPDLALQFMQAALAHRLDNGGLGRKEAVDVGRRHG